MADNIIDEYLVSLKPSVDMKAWGGVVGKIKDTVVGGLKDLYTGNYNLKDLDPSSKEYAKQADIVKQQNAKLESAAMYLQLFGEAVNYAEQKALEFAEKATELSQKFVTQSSIFVDTETRDTMGKFGVDATRAQSINAAAGGLGISMSDYAKLTQGQREAFSELMSHYEKGLRSIDPDKLERFNKSVNEYQLSTVKFEMDMQLIMNKFLTESKALPEILDLFTETMTNISNIMSSDLFREGADIFLGLLNGILEIAAAPVNFLGWLTGSGSSSSNSSTVDTVSSQQSIDLGLQIQNAMMR